MRPAAIFQAAGIACAKKTTMKVIKATFDIKADSDIAGVKFYGEKGKVIQWEELTREEQIKMLNAWDGMRSLFSRFVKEG